MNKKETKVIIQRIQNWYGRLPGLLINDEKSFRAKFGWSKEPTKFEDRMSLDYKPIKEEDSWGKKWESAWFHLEGDVPEKWAGQTVVANLDFSGEGLVHDNKGKVIQGITNASIWDPNFARTRVTLLEKAKGNERIELWVEAAANSLFGVFTDTDPPENSPKRHGWFDAKVEAIRFGIFDIELWHLYLDARILIGLLRRLDEDSVRRSRIILALNNCINVFCDDRANAGLARQ